MNSKSLSVFTTAFFITLMMLCFKIVGFVKQSFVAYFYGATYSTDLYFIAYGFISGVSESLVKSLSVSLIALYTFSRINKSQEKANKFISDCAIVMLPIFIGITFIVYFAAPFIVNILAPSYESAKSDELSHYIMILSPFLFLGLFELLFGAILDSHKCFFVPRFQSIIYSVSAIIACYFYSNTYGISALVYAQYISSIIFTLLLYVVARKYIRFVVSKSIEKNSIKSLIVTALPLFIGNSVLQINQIVDKAISTGLGDGVVSALSYCHILEQFVTNIMIVNIGNILFANFAEYVAVKDYKRVSATLEKAINSLICILTLITILTFVCSEEIVSIVYYRGSFSYDSVRLTSLLLGIYAISFVAVAIRDLFIKSLYAFKDTKLPMLASIFTISVNITLSIALSRLYGVNGVALATVISAFLGMFLTGMMLKRYLNEYPFSNHFTLLNKVFPASILTFFVATFIHSSLTGGYIYRFSVISFFSVVLYSIVLYILRVDIFIELYNFIKVKIRWRTENDKFH